MAGLGILRELPGDKNNIGDQIPVDMVANQILSCVPFCVEQTLRTGNNLLITHSSTSRVNPAVWGEVLQYLNAYWFRSPYETRVFSPNGRFYSSDRLY